MTEARKWYVTTKGPRESYARVVHTQECSYVPRATNAHIWTRNPLDEPDTSGVYPCERCKPQPSPETTVREKAKIQGVIASQAAQQQAYQEKVERIGGLANALVLSNGTVGHDGGDFATIEYRGHKYRIEETE